MPRAALAPGDSFFNRIDPPTKPAIRRNSEVDSDKQWTTPLLVLEEIAGSYKVVLVYTCNELITYGLKA
jgi:hypothetical protein